MTPQQPGTYATPADALTDAISLIGGQAALARMLGITQPSVWRWVKRGKPLPGEHVLTVEEATGISRHDLNPETFGSVPTEGTPRMSPMSELPNGPEPAR